MSKLNMNRLGFFLAGMFGGGFVLNLFASILHPKG